MCVHVYLNKVNLYVRFTRTYEPVLRNAIKIKKSKRDVEREKKKTEP